LDTLGEIISYAILFTGLFYSIFQKVAWTEQALFQLLVGIFIWYIGISAVAVFSFILQEEMRLGTLEQIYLTRTSLVKMLLGRAIGTFLFDGIGAMVLAVITFTFIALFTSVHPWELFRIPISWLSFVVVILFTMVGIYGFAFLLAGLSLVLKRIGAITIVLNYIFLFFTGITLSQQSLPASLDVFSKCLPITWGSINLKNIIISKLPLETIVLSPSFLWLVVNSFFYLFIGLVLFYRLEKRARKNGNLGSY
jgi:ABC-type polysaccharide/polyol phosphate export permease